MPIKNVAIAGAGGIGGYVAQYLYDFGVNRNQYPFTDWSIKIFDNDTVDASNCLHQNYGPEDIGENKATLIASRYSLTPELRFMTVEDFKDFDVIFCCVDDIGFRKDLYEYGYKHPELYWIDGRCSSRNIGVFNSKVTKSKLDPMLVTTSTERRGCLNPADKAKKKSHITPVIVATIMIQIFLNHYRGEDATDSLLLLI